MRSILFVLVLTSCVRKGDALTQGEAMARATEILGAQAFCKGESREFNSHSGWTCFEVESETDGHVNYKSWPLVVCIDSDCRRVPRSQQSMGAR